MSDLAVRVSLQKQVIGKELIRRTQAGADPKTMLLVLAAPVAEKHYPHIGFIPHPQAWMLRIGDSV